MTSNQRMLPSKSSSFPVPPPPSTIPPKPKIRRRETVLASVIIVTVLVSFASYWFFFRPPRYAWLFKGAYATYKGASQSLLPLNATIHIEVLDYNDSQAQLLFYFKVVTRGGTPVTESQNTTWVDLNRIQSLFASDPLQQTSQKYVYVEGVGSRYCTIYNYSSQSNSLTVCVDKELGWPVEFQISSESSSFFGTETFNIDINLVATNIAGLK